MIAARGTALASDGLLESDLWIDQPGALDEIERRHARGLLGASDVVALRELCTEGYCILRPTFPAGLFEGLDGDVERLWREQPPEIAYSYRGPLCRLGGSTVAQRRPSCRVADLHAWSEAARALYLDVELFRFCALAFGEQPIATQSLYFEWGSQQALHRDPTHVQMEQPAHLLAAWVALEDVAAESGPLVVVPGSHRLPYYQFEPGRFVHDADRDGDAGATLAAAWDRQHCAEAGLEPRPFLGRRGEVLVWHHSLLHGGSIPTDPQRTRKSFVIHYSTRRSMASVSNSYLDPFVPGAQGVATRRVYSTSRTLGGYPALGFDSPLRDAFLAEARELLILGGVGLLARLRGMEASRFWKLRNRWFAFKRLLHLTSES